MKRLLLFALLGVGILFLASCVPVEEPADEPLQAELEQLSDEELAAAATESPESEQLVGKAAGDRKRVSQKAAVFYVQRNSEVCDNGRDDNSNGLTDCTDVTACYSSARAQNNICYGNQNVDGRKVLLVGSALGYVGGAVVKSDRQIGQMYRDGDQACSLAFGREFICIQIDRYESNQWVRDSNVNCQTAANELNQQGRYRAVCGGEPQVNRLVGGPGESIPIEGGNPLEGGR